MALEEGERDEAERGFRTVIERDPRLRYSAGLRLGHLLLEEGRLSESVQAFQTATRERRMEAAPLLGMGRAFLEDDRLVDARECFQRAEMIQPGVARAGELLIADYLERVGRLPEAARVYERLAGSPPVDADAVRYLAAMEARRGMGEKADSLFELALRLAPEDPAGYNDFAWSLAERGVDLDRALPLARRARQLEPRNWAYADTEGWVLYRLGRHAEAVTSLGEAIDLGFEGAGVRYRLGFALTADGRGEEGEAALREALALEPDSPYADEARRLLGPSTGSRR
jgi:tetratricopeptide (TPR) repeat protein